MSWDIFKRFQPNKADHSNSPDSETTKGTSLKTLIWLSIIIIFLGILIVLLFDASRYGNATIFLWMLACLLAGSAIGFLFGIPKIVQNNNASAPGANAIPAYQQQVNTNLTDISDWLTKIIVGLGLVNLNKIPPYLSAVAKILATGLSQPVTPPTAMNLAFAYGTIISYTILGFLFGYLTTRLYLAGAFSEADQRAIRILVQKTEEAAGAARSALQKAEFALIKPSNTPSQEGQQPEQKLEELVQHYNHIRGNMISGSIRTNKMTEVIREMMDIVPLLTTYDVSQELKSDGGKRLSAYAFLYIKPTYQFVSDLVTAIVTDGTPFGQYWGIQALSKILELQPDEKLKPEDLKKLKVYYDQLNKGVDREYELRKIIPELYQ